MEQNHITVLYIAATQLSSIDSPCKVEEVKFAIWDEEGGYEQVKDHCKIIDEVLTGDNFPSLRRVQLFRMIPFECFPILQSRGLLESVD